MESTGTRRRAPLVVRTVKAGVTTVLATAALGLTLSNAFAGGAPEPSDSVRVVEAATVDPRCEGAAGRAVVRGPQGAVRTVSFAHGWKVYQGKRPGTLLVVCPD